MRYLFAALVVILLGALVYQQRAAREEARRVEAVHALACEVKAAVKDAQAERERAEKLAQLDAAAAPLVAQGLLPASSAPAPVGGPVAEVMTRRCPELEVLAGVACTDALARCP